MSYKCYNCDKRFDEDVDACDRCGTNYYMFFSEMVFFFWLIIGLVYIIFDFIKPLIGKR